MFTFNISHCQCGDKKIAEIRAVLRSLNLKLSGALGEPGATPGEFKRGGPMATLQEALDLAIAASAKTDKIIAAFADVKRRLDDVLSGVELPPAVQEKVDALFALEGADIGKLDTANPEVPPV